MRLVDQDGRVVADHLQVARSYLQKACGLLGRARFDEGEALLIEGCRSIHTHFMRFAIDVAYLDGDLRVVETVAGLRPWRLSGCTAACATLELPAGTLARLGLAAGARLRIEA